MTISELAARFDELMGLDQYSTYPHAKGFIIGKGRKLYWFITPMPKSGTYRCLGHEDDGLSLGWPRFIEPTQEVTVIY